MEKNFNASYTRKASRDYGEECMDGFGKFWKAAIGVGGVSAIGAFVFWSLYSGWLELDIFADLTSDQTFKLMLAFLFLVFGFAIAALFLWFLDKKKHLYSGD